MYNTYEEYMQNVLGVNMPNTYMQMPNNNYFEPRMQEPNLTEINKLYPEIYGIVYPMVQKTCSRRSMGEVSEKQINEMVEEIYNAIESGDEISERRDNSATSKMETKNTRETRRPNNNYLLRDLIKILIIRELLQGGMQGPVRPRPPMGGGFTGGMPYPPQLYNLHNF